MAEQFPYPFDNEFSGVVDANGDLVVRFQPPFNLNWQVSQVTLEMLTAPAGATAILRKNTVMIAPAFSARRAAIAGEPPVFLRPGDYLTVEWADATPGDPGRVWVSYRKIGFGSF